MGKQGDPKSPRPEYVQLEPSFGAKDPLSRCLDAQQGGRRVLGGDSYHWNKGVLVHGLKNDDLKFSSSKGVYIGRRYLQLRKHVRNAAYTALLLSSLFILDSLVFSILDPTSSLSIKNSVQKKESKNKDIKEEKSAIMMYGRLLNLASSALAKRELQQDSSKFWKEQYPQASNWKPCANKRSLKTLVARTGKPKKSNGFILVSANGGLNQQRVAVCNAVAVASLLNATLIIPKFLYSNVWKDPSQFGDIYQTEHFIKSLSGEVNIVEEVPSDLKSLDMEAIGSLITDADISKEAKPAKYVETVLPILLKNGIVHFLGFGNRLGFDPLPSELQRLRCKCNFHALKFVPKIQQIGSLLIKRIRKSDGARNMLDKQLLGNFLSNPSVSQKDSVQGKLKYIALHLRFEVDMVAYSRCDFGGGDNERRELKAYRESHFPLLLERLKTSTQISSTELRELGKCPLTPEEEALVLAGLGFKRETFIYLAGSGVYGGESRMHPLTRLYPNLITKEDLLAPSELAPFRNFSSQLAALDFIACATADVFSITDSGSQLSSLVSGFRTYYGGGHAPSLRPSKKRLAAILSENNTITWNSFEERIRKTIQEGQMVRSRLPGKSIYRHPRCPECMCKYH